MPLKSKAQQRLMYATLNGANTGVPKDVARDYVASTPAGAFPKLAERLNPKRVPTGTGSHKKRNVR